MHANIEQWSRMGVFPIRLHFFILKRLVEAYPTVTDSPVKALIINKTKNTR